MRENQSYPALSFIDPERGLSGLREMMPDLLKTFIFAKIISPDQAPWMVEKPVTQITAALKNHRFPPRASLTLRGANGGRIDWENP
jgi:hypothetical protein